MMRSLTIAVVFLVTACRMPGTQHWKNLTEKPTLSDWAGDTTYWRMEAGTLVGEVPADRPLKNNTFLVWQPALPADFELTAEFRISERGNSGINYRSVTVPGIPFALRGYQFDIDGAKRYTGQNYEERGRTTLAYRGEAVTLEDSGSDVDNLDNGIRNNAWQHRIVRQRLGEEQVLAAKINTDWNTCRLEARGNRLRHYVNGVLMSEVIDNDRSFRRNAGLLGFQLHVGQPMKVEYRHVRLRTFHE